MMPMSKPEQSTTSALSMLTRIARRGTAWPEMQASEQSGAVNAGMTTAKPVPWIGGRPWQPEDEQKYDECLLHLCLFA